MSARAPIAADRDKKRVRGGGCKNDGGPLWVTVDLVENPQGVSFTAQKWSDYESESSSSSSSSSSSHDSDFWHAVTHIAGGNPHHRGHHGHHNSTNSTHGWNNTNGWNNTIKGDHTNGKNNGVKKGDKNKSKKGWNNNNQNGWNHTGSDSWNHTNGNHTIGWGSHGGHGSHGSHGSWRPNNWRNIFNGGAKFLSHGQHFVGVGDHAFPHHGEFFLNALGNVINKDHEAFSTLQHDQCEARHAEKFTCSGE